MLPIIQQSCSVCVCKPHCYCWCIKYGVAVAATAIIATAVFIRCCRRHQQHHQCLPACLTLILARFALPSQSFSLFRTHSFVRSLSQSPCVYVFMLLLLLVCCCFFFLFMNEEEEEENTTTNMCTYVFIYYTIHTETNCYTVQTL